MLKHRAAASRLDELSRGRNNNLNLVRLLAAVGVVYGHAFGVGDRTAEEPFFQTFGIGVGDVCVDVFFLISGFLVTKSFLKRDLVHFAWARAARIYPALWASTGFLVLVCGLFFSPLTAIAFWGRHDTLTYLARNVVMLPMWGGQADLPYAFNNFTTEFNTSLWTLPYELQMYLLLTLIGVIGWLRSPAIAAAIAIGGACLYIAYAIFAQHQLPPQSARFLYFFFAGAAAHLAADRIPMRISFVFVPIAIVVSASALTSSTLMRQAALALALPYAVLWFSFVPAGLIRRFNRLGDYSYGVYILASPIQVFLALRLPAASPITRFALALGAVTPLAVLSWHCLEKRALGLPLPAALVR
jgi:peptidoglycan/LPS O-acetylase OafA/YrhL